MNNTIVAKNTNKVKNLGKGVNSDVVVSDVVDYSAPYYYLYIRSILYFSGLSSLII